MSQENNKNYCLATTALTELWDLDNRLLFLGPWCLTAKKADKIIEKKDYMMASSPWSLAKNR